MTNFFCDLRTFLVTSPARFILIFFVLSLLDTDLVGGGRGGRSDGGDGAELRLARAG